MLYEEINNAMKNRGESMELQLINATIGFTSIYLFGGGIAGKWALDWCRKHGISVTAFLDNNCRKQGISIDGIRVLSPDKLENTYDCYVIISCDAHQVIKRQLDDMGVSENRVGFSINYG